MNKIVRREVIEVPELIYNDEGTLVARDPNMEIDLCSTCNNHYKKYDILNKDCTMECYKPLSNDGFTQSCPDYS